MPDPRNLTLFVTSALILLVVPGPVVFYIVARSLEQGRVAGLVSTLGVGLGSVVHVSLAALGLSALVLRSAAAFALVKYLGAGYLIYLGIRAFRSPVEEQGIERLQRRTMSRLFLQGFVVNILNPKAALFFVAFLPQFVAPERGSVLAQILFLGGLFAGMAIVTDSSYALAAGTVGRRLSGNRRVALYRRNLSALTYLGLGIVAAVSGKLPGKPE